MGRKKQNSTKLQAIDITSLYAYADSSHARDRELWRGFLSSVLPLVLPQYADDIDSYIVDSLAESVEELEVEGDFFETQTHAIRSISAQIAESIGVSQEFALASFYDNEEDINLPTKLYKFHHIPVKKHIEENREETMINVWLSRFHRLCNEKSFLIYIEIWKDWLG